MSKNIQVQGTNDSSIVSKLSASNKNYFVDDFLNYFVSKPQSRTALINRGYYIRFKAIEYAFNHWLKSLQSLHCQNFQVISLGAGFDTSYFRLKYEGKLTNCSRYIEIDFPDVLKRKLACISSHSRLRNLLSECISEPFQSADIILHQKDYVLLGADLNCIEKLQSLCDGVLDINYSSPTLFLSECAVTYIEVFRSDSLIAWIQEKFVNSVLVVYEQISPNDGFGQVMQKHFQSYGSPLQSVEKYPDVESQQSRFLKMKWSSCSVMPMSSFLTLLDDIEVQRIQNLELFDEYETWHQKCAHYVLIYACQGVFSMSSPFEEKDLHKEKIEIFDAFTSTKSHELLQRYGHQVVWLKNNYFLISGGFGQLLHKHQRLKGLVLGNWKTGAAYDIPYQDPSDLLGSRMHHTMTALNDDKIIVFGGRAAPGKPYKNLLLLQVERNKISVDSCNNEFIQYTCEAVAQSGIGPTPKWRHSASLIHLDGSDCIFFFGGCSVMSKATNDCHILNTNTWTWCEIPVTKGTPMPRHSHSSVSYGNDYVIVSGGLTSNEEPLNSIHMFELGTSQWTTLKVTGLLPRYSHTSHIFQDYLILLGGVNSSPRNSPVLAVIDLNTLLSFEFLMPSQNCEFPILLHNHCSFIADDQIVAVGGGGNCFSFGTHFNSHLLYFDLRHFCKYK